MFRLNIQYSLLVVAVVGSFLSVAHAAKLPDSSLKLFIFTPECFTNYFDDFNFLDIDCLKTTASKAINLGIIAGAFVFKLPQVINMVRAGKVTGLSPTALYMDVAAFLPVTVYNIINGNDFVTYGELLVILVQNVLIVFLYWYYLSAEERPSFGTMLALPILAAGTTIGLSNLPAEWVWILPGVSSLFNIMSRIPTIAQNFSQKHTGVMSFSTWFLQLGGSLGRTFTSLHEKGISKESRPYIVGGQVVAVTLNVLVVIQIIAYWGETKKALANAKKKE